MVTRDHLLALISAGTAPGATEPQRQQAAQACQTLAVALGANAGQPLFIPGIPPPAPRPAGQVLDVIAAQLRTFLDRQQPAPAPASSASPSATSPEPAHAPGPATPSQ